MMKKCLLFFIVFFTMQASYAQKRYLEPVFNEVSKNTVIYGSNYTILTVPSLGHPVLQPLTADVYQPVGDTEAGRPLAIIFHSGNFLPYPQNGGVSGSKTDSTVVEISNRLAKMGYVSAAADYRLGWNPLASTQSERVNTLINAAYRGVQDARTAIRYFKLNASQFNIDTNKIVLIGLGTGGYVSLNTGVLDRYEEVINTTTPAGKFVENGVPYVHPVINGDIYGTSYGIVAVPGHPLEGDTLCKPNNVGPSSDFQLMVNLGGAMGDISWLDEKSPAVISFQSPTDPFAPYNTGVLIVPGLNLNVVEVQGALQIQTKANQLGLNGKFADLPFKDDISLIAKSKNGGLVGLYPIQRPADKIADSSPWDFWDPATNVNSDAGFLTNPDMSKAKAMAYLDTIVGFYAPRACIVLDLNCDLSTHISKKSIAPEEAGLSIAPNPANDFITIKSEFKTINGIVIFDMAGRAVKTIGNINSNTYRLERDQLVPGVYYAQVRFENEHSSIKFIFNGQ